MTGANIGQIWPTFVDTHCAMIMGMLASSEPLPELM